jgi:hypothetical protein
MASIVPPVVRPYSGMYPPLMTLTSFTNSDDSGVPMTPFPGLPMFRPSTM